ncbi:outer membrane beta-barrel domain-containing protein [Bdellovibrio sp. HCB337]|uniref:outer membrane beta-barrel domain-containing protein n=1 Tax=Bdellovibrio sp. HCB337 TaxID=3394358 RepID=UPI0039A6AF32
MNRRFKTLFTTALVSLLAGSIAHAQDSGGIGDDLNVIEMELDKTAPRQQPTLVPGANQRIDANEDRVEAQQNNKLTDFSGLTKLAPFSEISVIQKRFLPKTGRVQFTGGFSTITNNPWFFTAGVTLKAAYYLTEAWGIEGTYSAMSSSQRQAAKELHDNNGVSADSFGFPKNYIGADVKYTPFYGKMTWMNKKIVPFEHYFTGGAGNTSVSTGGSGFTLHFGTGQNFALSKRFSVNWDFSMMNYSAKSTDGTTQSFSDLLLTVGMSFFYPEAKYR